MLNGLQELMRAVHVGIVVGIVVVLVAGGAGACAVGECPVRDSWCEGDVMVFCEIDGDENEYEPPVGRRIETDCAAHGDALGVQETCHEMTTGQVGCVAAPVTLCTPGVVPACGSEAAAITCELFQSGGATDGPYESVFACAGGTRCVDGANGGQCVR